METIKKTDQEIITIELANAIASFNIPKIEELLSDKGEYCIQDEKEDIVISDKAHFINWLINRFEEFLYVNEDSNELDYTIDQCLHCKIGNPVIIFENGKFPVFKKRLGKREMWINA